MRLRFLGALMILAPLILVAPAAPEAQPTKVSRNVGLIEGQNILIEYRSAAGPIDRLTDHAADLVRLKVDVIVARGTPAVQAAKRATTEIPIIMAPAGDPVGTGLVASLGRPGAMSRDSLLHLLTSWEASGTDQGGAALHH